VYAKRPFAGSEVVLAYLSRYTHRVAGTVGGGVVQVEEQMRSAFISKHCGASMMVLESWVCGQASLAPIPKQGAP
jgi:hypothetical protein